MPPTTHERSTGRRFAVVVVLSALFAAACGSGDGNSPQAVGTDPTAAATPSGGASADGGEATPADGCLSAPDLPEVTDSGADEPTEVTLVTHDAFAVSEGIFDDFTASTGIEVELLTSEDAGSLVTQAALTAGAPIADVLFGIDNTFLCRGLEADVFLPYESPGLARVPDELELDPFHRVTPIDFGDVCVNVWPAEIDGDPPTSIDALTAPANRGAFVTQNPETSSPGMAFLLATIAKYGEPGWEEYWEALAANDISVTNGWTEAYFGDFTAGGGDRPIVTSYATSPVADVVFAEEPIERPNTAVIVDGCFRQVEFAGVLNGTDEPQAAAALVDFLLSDTFQNDIPLNMFVFPASETATPADVFVEHAVAVPSPLSIDPVTIEEKRSAWTERWNEIVFG